MKRTLLYLVVLVGLSCVVEAKHKDLTYIETHLGSNELGIQCTGSGQMSTRTLANMLIVSCK